MINEEFEKGRPQFLDLGILAIEDGPNVNAAMFRSCYRR